VLGYVDTKYGNRSEAAVKEDIGHYYKWLPVNGIFYDEMYDEKTTESPDTLAEAEAYYKGLDEEVTYEARHHGHGGSAYEITAGNAGYPTSSGGAWQLKYVDVVVTLENDPEWLAYITPFSTYWSWIFEEHSAEKGEGNQEPLPSDESAVLIHGPEANEEAMKTACSEALESDGAGWIYVTPRTEGENPWLHLASYFASEINYCD
jgi:hypothetical protein